MFATPWKVGVIVAAVVAAVLGLMLFMSYNDNKSLTVEKDKLISRIEDPKTGYIARLAQANANVTTLRNAIAETNVKMQAREAEANTSRAELNRLRKELAIAQAESRKMEARLKQFLSTKPQGDTLDARVRDIDARVLKELAQ